MNLQIETIKLAGGGSVDVIRDLETVRRLIAIAEQAMFAIRSFQCGHKPNGVSGKCDACEALKEWDALAAERQSYVTTSSGPSSLADHAEWQSRHRNMLEKEMQMSDRFLVEIASRLGVSCANLASAETRAKYAELRERILARLPNERTVAAKTPSPHETSRQPS